MSWKYHFAKVLLTVESSGNEVKYSSSMALNDSFLPFLLGLANFTAS